MTICLMALMFALCNLAFADVIIEGGDKSKLMNQHGTIVGDDYSPTDIDVALRDSLNNNILCSTIEDSIVNSTLKGCKFGIETGDLVQDQDQHQKQNQCQGQGQGQSQEATLDNRFKIENKAEIPVQGVAPSLPGQLEQAPAPEEKFLWNQLGVDIKELTRTWTLAESKSISSSWLFKRDTKAVFIKKYKQTKVVDLVLEKPCATFIGEVSISGKKSSTVLMCIGEAIEIAMANGADIVVLKQGINTIHNGTSAGLGGTAVNSHESTAATGLVSLGSADLRKAGEPAVILICYKKIATE